MTHDSDDAEPDVLEPQPGDLDLGNDHWLRWLSWAGSDDPRFAHLPPVDRYGGIILHPNRTTGAPCFGGIWFTSEMQRLVDPQVATWDVSSWEPLTISPSVLCGAAGCGDHGYIRDGRWMPV